MVRECVWTLVVSECVWTLVISEWCGYLWSVSGVDTCGQRVCVDTCGQ